MASGDIKFNLEAVQERIALACRRAGRSREDVTLIAVTKTVAPDTIETAYKLGICHFGENRVQEAEKKIKLLFHLRPNPSWHMIGHLQSNKIKTAVGLFDMIHSVDSLELAKTLDLRAQSLNHRIPVLLQVNVSGESSKNGFSIKNINAEYSRICCLPGVIVSGLMTIAPSVKDPEQVRPIFIKLRELRDHFGLEHLSMGMTDDFEVAIEEGATMIRLGRAIFGERSTL